MSDTIALYTIFLPFVLEILCARTVTTLDRYQPSGLVFKYATLLYLAFLLDFRQQETEIGLARLKQSIKLILTYLMVLLTDYVQETALFELISRLFIYGATSLIILSFAFYELLLLKTFTCGLKDGCRGAKSSKSKRQLRRKKERKSQRSN